jgi:hypothetical protein
MKKLVSENNIKGPIEFLFTRSSDAKKKNNNINMSASVPKIRVETEESSRPTIKVKNPTHVKGVKLIDDDAGSNSDSESVSSGSTVEASSKPSKAKSSSSKHKSSKFNADDFQSFVNNNKTKTPKDDDSGSESSYSGGSESGSESSGYSSDSGGSSSSGSSSKSENKHDSKKEKQEILLKLIALEKKGIELTKKYSMSSKLSDLKFELDLHKNQAEIDVSVKFQQKLLMAAVTGLEFMNNKFDPLNIKLDGWSESVMDNLDDYESIFIKLHEKYKHRADLPPELQLLVTLTGSAFMFHLTKTMFASSMPKGMDSVQTQEIMKNISNAMKSDDKPGEMSGPSLNLSNVLSQGRPPAKVSFDDASSSGTVETSKEVTVNSKGKKSINL